MTPRHLGRAAATIALLGACSPGSNRSLVDDSSFPTSATSSRRFKEDISYLSTDQRDDLAESLLTVRLATFRYKQGSKDRHLGYILEDTPALPASDMAHQRVDLYAYTSMAVAALQVQAAQIRQLESDLDVLTWQVDKLSDRRILGSLSSLSRDSSMIDSRKAMWDNACEDGTEP